MAAPSYLLASQLNELATPSEDNAPLSWVQLDGLVCFHNFLHDFFLSYVFMLLCSFLAACLFLSSFFCSASLLFYSSHLYILNTSYSPHILLISLNISHWATRILKYILSRSCSKSSSTVRTTFQTS